jgi:hypothetical protein
LSNIFIFFINFFFSVMRTGSASSPDDLLLNPPEAVQPTLHVVTSAQATSPVMSSMPMEPIPSSTVMSPDEMLRAYAERKKAMSANPFISSSSSGRSSPSTTTTGSSSPIHYPKAVVKKRSVRASLKEASNTMRGLYNATTKNLSPTKSSSSGGGGGLAHGYGHGLGRSADGRAPAPASAAAPVALSPFEPYDEDIATAAGVSMGMGSTENPHPFGYHPNAYTGGSYAIEEDEELEEGGGGGVAGRGAGVGELVYFGHAC